MGPTLRSMDKLFRDAPITKITNTKCPIQKTILNVSSHLLYWRYTLFHRYVGNFRPTSLHSHWQNYAAQHAQYADDNDIVLHSPIPSGLYQTTLRLNDNSNKLLTIHIYYTTGTILIQGKACNFWVEEEFPVLSHIVHTLADSDCTDCLTITVPVADSVPAITCDSTITISEVAGPTETTNSTAPNSLPAITSGGTLRNSEVADPAESASTTAISTDFAAEPADPAAVAAPMH